MEPRPATRAEAGYNLVVLIVAVTVLNILVAAMLPLWSTAIRREKEEELISRGFQYAEAIRVFRNRFQSYPTKLEDLINVRPRCIRQLWRDPMTEDGKWEPIFENQPTAPPRPPGDPNADPGDGGGDDENGRTPRKGDVVQVGPIVGVRSKSDKKSMLVLFGKERYSEWHFTALLFGGGLPGGGGPGGGGRGRGGVGEGGGNFPNIGLGPSGGLSLSTRWLGRPMRFFNQPPQGTLPNDQQKKKDQRRRSPNPS